jgi:hypothetical protein
MTGEMPEEWKNTIDKPVYKKSDKQKSKNYKEISLLSTYYKLSSKGLNEKLNVQADSFYWNARMDLKGRISHRSII